MLFVHQSRFDAPPEAVFAFHERPDALQRLIPPWEHVEVVQPPASLLPGTRVVLVMRLGPLRLEWVAEHTRFERDVLFEDRMLRGPFRSWVHTHRFIADGAGTLLRDEVEYALPLAPLSTPARPLVERRLRRMFAFRHAATAAALRDRQAPCAD